MFRTIFELHYESKKMQWFYHHNYSRILNGTTTYCQRVWSRTTSYSLILSTKAFRTCFIHILLLQYDKEYYQCDSRRTFFKRMKIPMKGSPCCAGLMRSCLHTYRTKTNLTQHIIQPSGGGGRHQASMGKGVINQLWGGASAKYGGGSLAKYG